MLDASGWPFCCLLALLFMVALAICSPFLEGVVYLLVSLGSRSEGKMILLYMDRWVVKSLLLLKLWSGGIGEQHQSNVRLIGCPCLLLLQPCSGCYGCALVAMVVL
jgi:hypothetical protein